MSQPLAEFSDWHFQIDRILVLALNKQIPGFQKNQGLVHVLSEKKMANE